MLPTDSAVSSTPRLIILVILDLDLMVPVWVLTAEWDHMAPWEEVTVWEEWGLMVWE